MILLRHFAGFLAGSLAAGLALALAVYPASDPELPIMALAAATHIAIFSAPFVLIAIGFAIWQQIANSVYYGLIGMTIGMVGLVAQAWSETGDGASILNPYAAAVILTAGLVGGVACWAVSSLAWPRVTRWKEVVS